MVETQLLELFLLLMAEQKAMEVVVQIVVLI
jgi:hypothetical protein